MEIPADPRALVRRRLDRPRAGGGDLTVQLPGMRDHGHRGRDDVDRALVESTGGTRDHDQIGEVLPGHCQRNDPPRARGGPRLGQDRTSGSTTPTYRARRASASAVTTAARGSADVAVTWAPTCRTATSGSGRKP